MCLTLARAYLPGNNSLQFFGRMTAAQRAAMDINEDTKGAPVHLTPYVFFFCCFSFFFPPITLLSYNFIYPYHVILFFVILMI
jgi:hypothetical protein